MNQTCAVVSSPLSEHESTSKDGRQGAAINATKTHSISEAHFGTPLWLRMLFAYSLVTVRIKTFVKMVMKGIIL